MPKITIGRHTAETLAQVLRQMQDTMRDLETLEVSMREQGIEALEIQGQAEMERALNRLGIFVENGRLAYREALRKRGAFGQSTEPTVERKKVKKKRG